MDAVSAALANTGQRLQELQEQNYNQARQRLGGFLKAAAGSLTEKGSPQTNIIDQVAGATYAFDDERLAELYARLEECRRSGTVTHFSHKQGSPALPYSGIMLDFDIALAARPAGVVPALACGGPARAVPAVLDDRAYRRLCGVVARALARDLVFGPGEVTLQLFFIVRPEVTPIKHNFADGTAGTAFKYGFHLLVPGVQVTRGYKKYLISQLRRDENLSKILLEVGAVGAPGAPPPAAGTGSGAAVAACLDANSASVPVLYLGSCKRGGTVYPLGAAFQVQGELEDLQSGGFGVAPIPEAVLEQYNLCYETALWAKPPHQLVDQFGPCKGGLVAARRREYRDAIAARVETTADRLAGAVLGEDEFRATEAEVAELCRRDRDAEHLLALLSLLDETYASSYPKWRNVVFALNNTGAAAGHDYLPLARLFSQRCPEKWATGGREALEQLWAESTESNRARRGADDWRPLSKRSITYWASCCSPARFKELSRNSYYAALGTYVYAHAGQLGHAMVGEILHRILSERFVVDITPVASGPQRYLWLEFVSAGQSMRPGEVWKWRLEAEPDELHKFISTELVSIANQLSKEIKERQEQAKDDAQAKYLKELSKNLRSSIAKLYDHAFKRSAIEQAKYLFRRRGFLDTLDKDPDIIGVGNGILRLAVPGRPRTQLISGYHEWPVSRYTEVAYRPFDPEEPWTKLLLGALKKIVPEIDMRVWLLMFLATGLYHGLKDPVMLFWVGSGANAKTFAARMADAVLGDYSTKLPISLLTAERERPNEPNSAVMRLKGRGLGYFEESNRCEVLNTSRLKEVVNPGELTASDKFKAQETFDLTATPLSLSNFSFIIETKDDGTWRRLRHYRAKAKFCAQPDPSNPYEHQDDKRFITEYVHDPECKTAFLGILVHFWERLQAEYGGGIGGVPCPTLARETEEFRNSQDVLNRFITERVVASPNNTKAFPLAFISARFCEWYLYNIEVGSRRYVATEVIGDLENSILSRYLTTSPNGVRMVSGCRCLSEVDAGQPLQEGETYIGARGIKALQGPPRFGPYGEPEPDNWWDWKYAPLDDAPPQQTAPQTAPQPAPQTAEQTPTATQVEDSPEWGREQGLLDDKILADGRLRREQERVAAAAAAHEKERAVDAAFAALTAPPPAPLRAPDLSVPGAELDFMYDFMLRTLPAPENHYAKR